MTYALCGGPPLKPCLNGRLDLEGTHAYLVSTPLQYVTSLLGTFLNLITVAFGVKLPVALLSHLPSFLASPGIRYSVTRS